MKIEHTTLVHYLVARGDHLVPLHHLGVGPVVQLDEMRGFLLLELGLLLQLGPLTLLVRPPDVPHVLPLQLGLGRLRHRL